MICMFIMLNSSLFINSKRKNNTEYLLVKKNWGKVLTINIAISVQKTLYLEKIKTSSVFEFLCSYTISLWLK